MSLRDEIRDLETTTFEILDMPGQHMFAADGTTTELAVQEMAVDWSSSSCSCSSCCSCSTSSCCSCSTSSGCGG